MNYLQEIAPNKSTKPTLAIMAVRLGSNVEAS
jgi:hypothetical protein